jgi:predicted dithiol-disulfide oxidoreductase (DUF899 family)
MEHQVVSQQQWLEARKALLAKEKELTHRNDQLAAERRALPWVRVDKRYVFDTHEGKQTLAELFGNNSQLIIYHFMLGPDWEAGCPGCSFLADHFDGPNQHLQHHDISLIVVSRAPLAKIDAYRKRMGWKFRWVSSLNTDFNSDYNVSFTKADIARGDSVYNYEIREDQSEGEAPGISVFYRNTAGDVFHTYSSYARGGDILIGAHNFLDLTPKGRNEHTIMDWMRRHDEYAPVENKGSCCGA